MTDGTSTISFNFGAPLRRVNHTLSQIETTDTLNFHLNSSNLTGVIECVPHTYGEVGMSMIRAGKLVGPVD